MSYDLSKMESGEERSSVSSFIGYGSGQVLRINSIEFKVSSNTGSAKPILNMETKPIKDPSFKPIDGAKGQVGRIACGVYMNTEERKIEFLRKLKMIGEALGLKEEIDAVKGKTFEEAVKNSEKVICGSDKWAKYTIFAEEYRKADGKIGVTYMLPRYSFVEHVDEDNSKLIQFDKTNKSHYKPVDNLASPYVKTEPIHDFTGGRYDTANDEASQDLPF